MRAIFLPLSPATRTFRPRSDLPGGPARRSRHLRRAEFPAAGPNRGCCAGERRLHPRESARDRVPAVSVRRYVMRAATRSNATARQISNVTPTCADPRPSTTRRMVISLGKLNSTRIGKRSGQADSRTALFAPGTGHRPAWVILDRHDRIGKSRLRAGASIRPART